MTSHELTDFQRKILEDAIKNSENQFPDIDTVKEIQEKTQLKLSTINNWIVRARGQGRGILPFDISEEEYLEKIFQNNPFPRKANYQTMEKTLKRPSFHFRYWFRKRRQKESQNKRHKGNLAQRELYKSVTSKKLEENIWLLQRYHKYLSAVKRLGKIGKQMAAEHKKKFNLPTETNILTENKVTDNIFKRNVFLRDECCRLERKIRHIEEGLISELKNMDIDFQKKNPEPPSSSAFRNLYMLSYVASCHQSSWGCYYCPEIFGSYDSRRKHCLDKHQ